LIVDVQNGFVNNSSCRVLPVIGQLAAAWLARGAPIYMSQFTNHPGSRWETLIGWRRLRDEPEIALCPELSVFSDRATIYRKHSYSCVVGPFAADLDESSWDEVVLCGIATDGCVLATAVDLFEYRGRDIRPIVVRDACASHAGEQINDAGLLLIERFIGRRQVVTSAELLARTHELGA
jgi:nicotinamidase-related amidase